MRLGLWHEFSNPHSHDPSPQPGETLPPGHNQNVGPRSQHVLNVRQSLEGGVATYSLSGRIEAIHIPELKSLLATAGTSITLNLQEVTIVGQEVVSFLAHCEKAGISLRNCPGYIRTWLDK